MRAVLFSSLVAADTAKLTRMAEERGLSVARVVLPKSAKNTTVDEPVVIFCMVNTSEGERRYIKDAIDRSGATAIEVGLRIGHPGWDRIALLSGPETQEHVVEWRQMAESLATDVDRLKGEASRAIGDRDTARSRASAAERERDLLAAQVRDLKARIERQSVPPVSTDEIRRLTTERNAAQGKTSEVQYALGKANERAEKAEAEAAVLRRRPDVDANKLTEMTTTLDGLRSQVTRLTLKLAEMTEDRDAKDDAMRKAHARASAAETKLEQASRSAKPMRLAVSPKAPASSPLLAEQPDEDFILDGQRRGLFTAAEALELIRKARAS